MNEPTGCARSWAVRERRVLMDIMCAPQKQIKTRGDAEDWLGDAIEEALYQAYEAGYAAGKGVPTVVVHRVQHEDDQEGEGLDLSGEAL